MTVALAGVPVLSLGATTYQMMDLGDLGGEFGRARAVNAQGLVIGEGVVPLNEPDLIQRAVLWRMGVPSDLGTLGGTNSAGTSVNANGTAGGWAQDAAGGVHPVLWDGGGVRSLPTLGGVGGAVWGLNDAGWAVGGAAREDGSYRAVLWRGNGVMDLGTFGGDYSVAYDANDLGWIVGTALDAAGQERAALWSADAVVDLGSLSGGQWTAARGVNEARQLILWGRPDDESANRAAFWNGDAASPVVDLGTLGGAESWAFGLNNLGAVVGWASTVEDGYHAFVWNGSAMTDLGTLGGRYSAAYGINDEGMIVGSAHDAAGVTHAVAWIPVPEPSGSQLLGLGVLWLIIGRARVGGPRGI
jgi:probable HAF family extracellular repeat protein